MQKEELFQKAKVLVDKLEGFRKTSILSFESVEEKLTIRHVYNAIYPHVQVDLSCPTCVLNYLYMLNAWFEREYPIYLESIKQVEEAKPTSKKKKPKTGK